MGVRLEGLGIIDKRRTRARIGRANVLTILDRQANLQVREEKPP